MAILRKTWSSSRGLAGLVLTVALVGLLLAGCGGSSASSQSTTTASHATPSSSASTTGATSSHSTRSASAHGGSASAHAGSTPARSGGGDHAQGAPAGSKATSRTFLAHAGLAFGIFQHDVYKPFKAGQFRDPQHQRQTLARARTATLLALNEVVRAKQAAETTTALRKLFIPLGGLEVTLSTLATQFKHGHLDPLDIRSANSTIAGIDAAGSLSGLRIVEHTQP
jgi:hypothetical protein